MILHISSNVYWILFYERLYMSHEALCVHQTGYSSEYNTCVLYLHVSVPPLGPISMIQ